VEEVNILKVDGATEATLNDVGDVASEDPHQLGHHGRWVMALSPSGRDVNGMQPFTNFQVGANVDDDTCSDVDAVVDFLRRLPS
jgi:hypothetical protein